MTRGLYQQGNWAILQKDDGSRTIVLKADYENCGYQPPLGRLDTDVDFHLHALGTHISDVSSAANS